MSQNNGERAVMQPSRQDGDERCPNRDCGKYEGNSDQGDECLSAAELIAREVPSCDQADEDCENC